MREETKNMLDIIREYQNKLTDDERTDLWYEITKGYCKYCGTDILPCYCWNEE